MEFPLAKLDHIMFATTDLDLGITEIADLTGIKPAIGGTHPGMGTRNALLSLGEDQYLEVIAPDPEQELKGSLGEELINHGGSGVRGWAVAATDLEAIKQVATEQGLNPQPLVEMNRTTPAGVPLDWQIMFVAGHPLLPFFINWKLSPHPARNTPVGCTLFSFTVATPDHVSFKNRMSALDIEVAVVDGDNGLTAQLATPSGTVTLGNW